MEKQKIAITLAGYDEANLQLIQSALGEPAMLELCTPVVMEEKTALHELGKGSVDALVLAQAEPAKCPAGAYEIIVTDKTDIIALDREPTVEDIVKLRDILERDFDVRSPRFAIATESAMQNPELATQATTEQGINTYGPYTAEQVTADDAAYHFDGIITTDKALAQRIVSELSAEAPVRYFAGKASVVTAIYQHVSKAEEEGLADVSWLTHPFFVATDILRNRIFYDEARKDILPKLFRDKREDRKKDEAAAANANNDNTEKDS